MLLSIDLTFAGTKSKTADNKHIIGIPNGGWVTVRTHTTYAGTYSDGDKYRTFKKHKETVYFTSLNNKALTKKLKKSIGKVVFYTPNKKVICNVTTCDCSFIEGSKSIGTRHHCSNTKTKCKINSSAYCNISYTITGGINIINKTCELKGLAK